MARLNPVADRHKLLLRGAGAKVTRVTAFAARQTLRATYVGAVRGWSAIRAWPRTTMELVFPAACVSCGAEINPDESATLELLLCDECFESLNLLQEPMCRLCGGPLPLLSNPVTQQAESGNAATIRKAAGCFRCRGRKLWFDETIAAGLYEGRLRELLLRMKSDKGDPLSLAMGKLLWQVRQERLRELKVDVVVPIPLHWRRRLVHRTNSAAVLAEVLAGRLRAPMADGLLRRRTATRPQSEMTPPQRWKNVRQAFRVGGSYHLKAAHVLLVDDIFTTGATCSEAARTLRKAGAERVTVAVVARAIG